MGAESVDIVSSRSLNEPGLFCFPEQPVFNFAAGIIAVVDFDRLLNRTIGEDNESAGVGVVALERVVQHDYGIYGIGGKVFAILVTAASELPVESGRSQRFDANDVLVVNNMGLVLPGSNRARLIHSFPDTAIG